MRPSAVLNCEVIKKGPIRFKKMKLKAMKPRMAFYEDDRFEALVVAASRLDDKHLPIVLLGGGAGLRRGEIAALKWSDVDLKRKQLTRLKLA